MKLIGITFTLLGIMLLGSEPVTGLVSGQWFKVLGIGALSLIAGIAILSKTIKEKP